MSDTRTPAARAVDRQTARRALTIRSVGAADLAAQLREDVLAGLAGPRPREVPSAYLYDDRGSVMYDAVTDEPDYYLARHETALLQALRPELGRRLRHAQLVELGSGTSRKTRWVLDALGAATRRVAYLPIDVNRAMLHGSGQALMAAYPRLTVRGVAGRFQEAVEALAPAPDRLFLFLGGTVGNLTANEQLRLFHAMGGRMGPRSHLLLGFDRRPHARKPPAILDAAYNDRAGRLAALHLNVLARMNRELGADFRPGAWAYRAGYDPRRQRVDMALHSLADQRVTIPALGSPLAFAAGEPLRTAISRKFDPDELARWFGVLGFRRVAQWTDPAEYVGLALFTGPLG